MRKHRETQPSVNYLFPSRPVRCCAVIGGSTPGKVLRIGDMARLVLEVGTDVLLLETGDALLLEIQPLKARFIPVDEKFPEYLVRRIGRLPPILLAGESNQLLRRER